MVIFLEFAISASHHVIAAQPQVRQVMEQQAAAAGELSNLRRSTTAPLVLALGSGYTRFIDENTSKLKTFLGGFEFY